ncbi:MAG: TonB-dependent receptor [Sphingomicrobium sp.]
MTRKIDLSLLAKSGASLLAIAVACSSSAAFAQTTAPGGTTASDAPAPSGSAVEDSAAPTAAEEVIVVGSRASQQSANNRKKRARTATDSIVADDIGSFPDRNVSEAMSRLPGVALNRNDFGEGEGVSIRGNGMGQIRVELDGVGVQSTTGVATTGADAGRSADMRELPAELVKSIDVVKGSTADMTEGGLGGSVQIQTRTGLDFKKPYLSLRAGAQRNSLSRKITPDFNAVAASRFFDDRLGVIMSGSYNHVRNDSHRIENTTSGNTTYNALFDFDNSPDKTFTFNPATVGTDAADVNFGNSFDTTGAAGLTPRELVTAAAGATSKAQCLTIFPYVATQTEAQRGQRILEQQTCLNQWNDYTPALIRHFTPYQDEKRIALDARVDFKVTDNLTVYGKVTQANRKVDDQFSSRNPLSIFRQNQAGTFGLSNPGGNQPYLRTLIPTPGFYLYGTGINSSGGAPLPAADRNRPVRGDVINVVPGSVTVDDNHYVTQLTSTNNDVNIDQISNVIDSKTRYMQGGAQYRLNRLEIDAFVGSAKAKTTRADMRTNRTYRYGDATIAMQPSGLWSLELPDNYDETDMANFVQLRAPACLTITGQPTTPPNCIGQAAVTPTLTNPASSPAYTVGQMPLATNSFSVSYSPRIGETSEKIAKFDLAYRTDGIIPFITRVKVGGQYRNPTIDSWGAGGYTARGTVDLPGTANDVSPIIVPTANVRGSLRACEPTAGSSAPGGLSCNYGFVPSTEFLNVRQGVDTLTPAELQALFTDNLGERFHFFRGYPGGGDLPPGWQGIQTDKLFSELGAYQFMNFDCVKTCIGSDGQVYDQPLTQASEVFKNIYGMVDFELRMPLGMRFDGNVGIRGVFVKRDLTGNNTLNVIRIIPGVFSPANPTAAAGFTTQALVQNINFKGKRRDWLPSVNLNLWAFNDTVVLRAYGGKTLSHPNVSSLTPGGNCTVDQRELFEADGPDTFGCGGRFGNPNLKPFSAQNRNLSLEWYPNRDTVFSVALAKLRVKTGNPIAVSENYAPYEGTERAEEIDPITGARLGDITFTVPTWANGPGFNRRILEFSAKTAFTFLPWILRHTGVDANISMLKSAIVGNGIQDPHTGDKLMPPGESKRYTNLSLWYDDGKLNMRVAWQKRSSRFRCIAPCGGNAVNANYPGEGWTNVRLVAPGYLPGAPLFDDGDAYIDAKMSYNVNKHLQVYLEGRNLTRQAQTISFGQYLQTAENGPVITRFSYPGRRILGGVRVQFGN